MKYKLKTKIVYNNMLLNANLYTETIKMFVVVFSNVQSCYTQVLCFSRIIEHLSLQHKHCYISKGITVAKLSPSPNTNWGMSWF